MVATIQLVRMGLYQSNNFIFNIVICFVTQNGKGVAANHKQHQYVDPGIQYEACLTHPAECETGRTMALWINKMDCPVDAGIISTRSHNHTEGGIVCTESRSM